MKQFSYANLLYRERERALCLWAFPSQVCYSLEIIQKKKVFINKQYWRKSGWEALKLDRTLSGRAAAAAAVWERRPFRVFIKGDLLRMATWSLLKYHSTAFLIAPWNQHGRCPTKKGLARNELLKECQASEWRMWASLCITWCVSNANSHLPRSLISYASYYG